mmetsp:Transcript_5941/g.13070  ORF Transcript_5941/g.13070 Transcript_5941/m.13070 type:complete len:223 (+) Transcript_5941:456-1124(+)
MDHVLLREALAARLFLLREAHAARLVLLGQPLLVLGPLVQQRRHLGLEHLALAPALLPLRLGFAQLWRFGRTNRRRKDRPEEGRRVRRSNIPVTVGSGSAASRTRWKAPETICARRTNRRIGGRHCRCPESWCFLLANLHRPGATRDSPPTLAEGCAPSPPRSSCASSGSRCRSDPPPPPFRTTATPSGLSFFLAVAVRKEPSVSCPAPGDFRGGIEVDLSP